jgi:hypothetical protein
MTNSYEQKVASRPVRPSSKLAELWVKEPMLAITGDKRALVRFFHDKVKLTDAEIATAMGTGPGTVRRWRSPKAAHEPRDVRRLDNIRTILALLVNSGVLTLEEAGGFLRSQVVPPNDEVPLDLLGAGGDGYARVREVAASFVDDILGRRAHTSSS